MKGRLLWVLMMAGVVVAILVSLALPQRMISPGALIRAHAQLETDCFACHAPWRGAIPQRCTRCHQVLDIGLRTSRGVPLAQRRLKASFHAQLIEQDCVACHVGHVRGPASGHVGDDAGGASGRFSHTMLRPGARPECERCHASPGDTRHRDLSVGCMRCHQPERWKPAEFDHAALSPAEQRQCGACHHPPADDLHRSANFDCTHCHSQRHWKPSTFDHVRLFVLDADHNASCATCHLHSDLRRYSCYGCHAHRVDRIRAVHSEEGIRDFADCVRCHRDPGADPEGGDGRERSERD